MSKGFCTVQASQAGEARGGGRGGKGTQVVVVAAAAATARRLILILVHLGRHALEGCSKGGDMGRGGGGVVVGRDVPAIPGSVGRQRDQTSVGI